MNIRLLDLLGLTIALGALAVLAARALLRFDDSWDGTSYHLVFAAFRAGLLTRDDFVPLQLIQDLYTGFPPLLDIIRGYTWKLTGHVRPLQLYSWAAPVILAGFWKLRFGLQFRWSVIALLSIPLLQIAATALYVDIVANCFFAIPLSILTAAFIEARPLPRADLWTGFTALAVAANTKLQFVPLSGLLLVVIWAYQLSFLLRRTEWRSAVLFTLAAGAASFVVLATAWRNILLYGNPIYPMGVTIFGHHLPGPLWLTLWVGPDYLAHSPQWLKWLLSVLEFRAFEGRDLPYTIDQHPTIPFGVMPPLDRPKPPAFRMGGYFVPLVLGTLVFIALFRGTQGRWERLRWYVPVLCCTAVVALVPGSSELRYFSFWMINLVFIAFLAASDAPQFAAVFRCFLLAMFVSVGMVTGWRYFDPTPYSVQDHIKRNGIDLAVNGQDICFENRNRDPILFTRLFHDHGRYRVVDLDPEKCPAHERAGVGPR